MNGLFVSFNNLFISLVVEACQHEESKMAAQPHWDKSFSSGRLFLETDASNQ